MDTLLLVTTILLAIILILLVVLLLGSSRNEPFIRLQSHLLTLQENLERFERMLREEHARDREESANRSYQQRNELTASLASFAQVTEQRVERMRETVERQLKSLQEDNSKKLDEMRATVDEKLHATLEQRLGESFKLVSERLELVHRGLGEMQSLASGVGDLRKVLTNVKTRGTWGEIQLGNLLEQILAADQYGKNVATKKGSNDRVEFAIRLPGSEQHNHNVWLPIDAKFPQEDYQRLVEASEQANPRLVEEASKMLEVHIKNEAKAIREKYLDPPRTTDFGIMFLPTEGLYAEVTRRPGLTEVLQRDFRVTIMGPNTLAAFLNSLQMGFRTLAIERRSSEVWALLGAVKSEFGRFGDILSKTQKKLQEASNTIEDASRRTRAIEQKLKDVEQLPAQESLPFLSDRTDKSSDG